MKFNCGPTREEKDEKRLKNKKKIERNILAGIKRLRGGP